MKLLYLLSRQYSKYFLRELIIMVQLFILVVVVNIAISPIIYSVNINNSIANGVDNNVIYFSPYNRTVETMLFGDGRRCEQDIYAALDSNSSIKEQGIVKMGIANVDGLEIPVLFYNDSMITNTQYTLKSGTALSTDLNDMVNIPIIASSSLNKEVDEEVTIELFSPADGSELTVNVSVSGILKDNTPVYQVLSSGSLPDIKLVANNIDNVIIMPLSCKELLNSQWEHDGSRLVFLKQNSDKEILRSDLQNQLGKYGNFTLLNDMTKNEFKNILGIFKDEIILAFIVFFLLIFGLSGYLLLICLKNEKNTSIYMLCGIKKSKIKQLYIVHALSFTIPVSIFATFYSINYIRASYQSTISQIDAVAYCLPTVITFIIIAISLIIAFTRLKRITIMDLQRKGA